MKLNNIIKKYLKIDASKIYDMQIGSQNKTYLIDNNYVIKVYNKDTINSEEKRLKREQKDIVSIEAKRNNINTITPMKINGKYIHKEGNTYFSFYPYTNYKSVEPKDINDAKIINLTNQIKKMHKIDFMSPIEDKKLDKQILNLDRYLVIYEKTNKDLFDIVTKNRQMLEILSNFINTSLDNLKTKNVICHNDLKPANILWNNDIPYLVDWDACGYSNPSCAFNEYAYFLSTEHGILNEEKFRLFVNTYYENNKLEDDIDSILYVTLYGKMSWLIYSLERSIYISQDERHEGEKAVKGIIDSFNSYLRNYNKVKQIYEELNEK